MNQNEKVTGLTQTTEIQIVFITFFEIVSTLLKWRLVNISFVVLIADSKHSIVS